jgi:RecB family exonuclease
VIVRSGAQIAPIERGLAAFDVPTRVSRARVALRDEPVVRAFTAVLELAFGRRELTAELAEQLFLGPLSGADAVMLRRLKRALRQLQFSQLEFSRLESVQLESGRAEGEKPSSAPEVPRRAADELLVESLLEPGMLSQIEPRVARRAVALAGILKHARDAAQSSEASVEELLWDVWQRSGLAEPWYQQSLGTGLVAEETNHNLDAVVALFAAAKRFVERTPEAPGTLFLEQLLDADVPEDTLARAASTTAVTVTTPTGTIGSEYSLVIVAGVQDNVWPNLRIRNSLLGAGTLEAVLAGTDGEAVDDRTGVLHDELRMFAQAVSRAKRELVITAVSDDNAAPSPLFRLFPDPTPGAISRTPLSLRGLVGVLRRQTTSKADIDSATALARLARERVPGADPGEWYGLAPLSTSAPLVELGAEDAVVRVSPSRMESFEACPLDWVIDQLGGGSGNTASRLGTLIHKAMEEAVDISPDALFASIAERWGELYFDSWWLSDIKKVDARELVGRLSAYLTDFERAHADLVSAESTFELPVGPAVLRGSIDRVEHYPDGSIVIVDLKTGKRSYTAAEIAENAQLGAYQLAFAAGQVPNVPPEATAGGARLLIVSKDGKGGRGYLDQTQPPKSALELAEFESRVIADAEGMAAARFQARIGSHCLDPWSHGACRIHVIKAVSS